MTDVLSRNYEADRIHQNGLEALREGDFSQARVFFDEASDILTGDDPTIDGLVQGARIARHSGYSYLREAAATQDVSLLDSARGTIESVIGITAPLMSGTAFVGIDVAASLYKKSPKGVRREIANEHGGALSLLAREVTARNVLTGFDSRGDGEPAAHNRSVDQQPYGLAYDILRMGKKASSLVSHSMYGGRQEVLNGQGVKVWPWVGRAARGVVIATVRGGEESKRARASFVRGWQHLEDYETARESVLLDP